MNNEQYKSPTLSGQNGDILAWLQSGKRISAAVAYREFGCLRLAARIHDLKQAGHSISKEMETHNGKKFAVYSLDDGQAEFNF